MEKPEDLMMTLAKSMHDSNRSGANYGKLFLLKDIIMELDKLNLGVTSRAAIKTFLENKDGTTKEFKLKDSVRYKPLEYLCEDLDTNMLDIMMTMNI